MAASQRQQPEADSQHRYGRGFVVGTAVGVTLAGCLNPVDKALYLMVKERRPLFTRSNWEKPFEGLSQALVVRTLSGGMFYPLFDCWQLLLGTCGIQGNVRNSGSGLLTGVTTAVAMNPFNAVKYQMWGKDNLTMRGTAKKMYEQRGLAAFTRAIQVTVARDSIFGMVYSGGRLFLNRRSGKIGSKPALTTNLCAASLAVTLSSPLNYARNMQFGAEGSVPCLGGALQRLRREVVAKRQEVGLRHALVYLQHRLALGWGTLRVGVGMALGQHMYDWSMTHV